MPTSYSSAAAAAAAESKRGPAGPITIVKRRIARWLAARPIVGVTGLGYVSAVMVIAGLLAGVALVALMMPAAIDLLQNADIPHAWAKLGPDGQRQVEMAAGVAAALGLAALLLFSIFIGLSTHNAPALGADMPILTPYAAGVAGARAAWRHAQIALCAAVPAGMIWLGSSGPNLPSWAMPGSPAWSIGGLIVAIIFVEVALRRLEDPWGWFRGPNRHVPDLYVKLGTAGSIDSLSASTWALAYRVSNSIAVPLWFIPPVALVVNVVAKAAGQTSVPGWQAGGIGPLQGLVAFLVAATLLTGVLAQLLLVPLIVGFVRRQDARRALVRQGRARSWVGGRPGAADYASVRPGQVRPEDWADDDRIVERAPLPAPPDDGGAELLASINQRAGTLPGAGPAGVMPPPDATDSQPATPPPSSTAFFGAKESPDRLPGRGAPSNDQASLNSPSTTSSFPWSEPPESE